MRKRLGLVLSFLISIVFLYLAFKKVDAREIGQSLLNVNLSYFTITVLLTFFAFFLRAIRWQILLNPSKKLPLPLVYHATMIGFMCNFVLPARIGELIRAYLIGARGNMSKSSAFATIIIERVLDVFIISFFTAVIVIFFSVPDWVKRIGIIISILNISIFIILLSMHKKKDLFFTIIEKILKIFGEGIKEKIKKLLYSFIEGLDILEKGSNLIIAIVLSIVIWSISGLFFFVLFYSLPIRLPLYAAFLDMIILNFGIMIPSTTGFIGTFQFFVKEGLTIFQINPNTALSYSILLYVSQFLPVVGLGIVSLWIWGLDFKKLQTNASAYDTIKKRHKRQS
jgi:uncharacterized protein (TIRG00374 family)